MAARGAFWDDVEDDLRDPAYRAHFEAEAQRIALIDELVSQLDEARLRKGWSKAALARALSAEPSTIRRLFGGGEKNPTIGTVTTLAGALGYRVVLEPVDVPRPRDKTSSTHRRKAVRH